jgi:hypothetical protein
MTIEASAETGPAHSDHVTIPTEASGSALSVEFKVSRLVLRFWRGPPRLTGVLASGG